MKRLMQLLLILITLSAGFGLQPIAHAETDANIGKFEYGDNSLQPTDSTGYPPKPKEEPNAFQWVLNKLGIPDVDIFEPAWEALKDTGGYVKDKASDAFEWTKDKFQDGMEAANEWWNEQNKFTKSVIILAGGAVVLAGAVVLTPLAGGAALVMGVGGALSYGMYAATTDNVSFWGGMAFMGLGMIPGGAGLLVRGTRFAGWAAKGAAVARSGLRFVGGFFGRSAMIGGGISAGIAGGTHLYNHFVNGQPLDAKAMVTDMVAWGAAGTIAGPIGRTTMKLFRSKMVGTSAAASAGAGSEYALGNLFKGKAPSLKTTALVMTLSAALPLAGLAVAKGGTFIKGNPTAHVSQASTQVSDTAIGQAAGKTASDVKVNINTPNTRTIIDGDNHITINPIKNNQLAPNVGLNKPVAGDNLSLNIKNNIGSKNVTNGPKINVKEVSYGNHIVKQGRKKVLQPNIKYVTPEGYKYTTDEFGRISSVEGILTLGKAKRNSYAQRTVGGSDRLSNDDGGHLVASIFKGSGEIDNLVPMDANLNRSEFKILENTWKKAVEKGKTVQVNILPIYKTNTNRPTSFFIEYSIDGVKETTRLKNYIRGD